MIETGAAKTVSVRKGRNRAVVTHVCTCRDQNGCVPCHTWSNDQPLQVDVRKTRERDLVFAWWAATYKMTTTTIVINLLTVCQSQTDSLGSGESLHGRYRYWRKITTLGFNDDIDRPLFSPSRTFAPLLRSLSLSYGCCPCTTSPSPSFHRFGHHRPWAQHSRFHMQLLDLLGLRGHALESHSISATEQAHRNQTEQRLIGTLLEQDS
jgi:hypothetical protein